MKLEQMSQDLRYAVRSLRQSAGLTAIVAATLALGIAANAVVLSFINPYLFRPLPFAVPERLVQMGLIDPVSGWDQARLSLPQYLDWKERNESFAGMAAYRYLWTNLTGGDLPERIHTCVVTGDLFPLLGAGAQLGRTLLPADQGPGGADVLVLSHELWQRRFGGDTTILGRTVAVDGAPHEVVGVMPPRFNFPFGGIKMWVPLRDDPATADREETSLIPIGRLAPGRTVRQAYAELAALQRTLAETHPQADGRFAGVTVLPLRQALNFSWDLIRVSSLLLAAAVVFLLLIACVNVASLMLARASTRGREVAIRSALGAGRGRLLRQLLTESLILALASGVIGVLLAHFVARMMGPILPEDLYRVGEMTVDLRVLAVTAVITLLTPLVFGLAPALSAVRRDIGGSLRGGGRGGTEGRRALRGRRALVVVQVALALVLLTGAGLMLRSFAAVERADLGFAADRILTIEVSPPQHTYDSLEELSLYYRRALEAVAALPGVESAGAVMPLPLNHETWSLQFQRPETSAAPESWPAAVHLAAMPGYFRAMGIPILAGRGFTDSDRPDGDRVLVINRSLAETWFTGESPVGRTLLVGKPETPRRGTVIGVVENVKHSGIDEARTPQVYEMQGQSTTRRRFLVVQTSNPPGSLAPLVRDALFELDPNLPLTVRPMIEVVGENQVQWSVSAAFLGVFGAVALLLALLGLYGVLAYSVTRRRREMGIRLALGATGRQVEGLVVREGLRLTAVGLAVGLALALGTARLMASLLFGVGPFDPVTLGGVVALFLTVAFFASALPARRAGRVDPVGVLKEE